MSNMKGFMHVVEIILVLLLMFFVFIQFATIPTITTDWPKSKLTILARDIIFSAEKSRIDWFNETAVKKYFSENLPPNTIYSVNIYGSPKSIIRTGCVCDDAQTKQLYDILSSGIFINNRNITFQISQITSIDSAFSQSLDAIVLMNYSDLGGYQEEMTNYLKADKGIIEIFDVNSTITSNPIKNSTFGMSTSTVSVGSENIYFTETSSNPENEIYKPLKYFIHFPIFYDDFSEKDLKWNVIFGAVDIVDDHGNPRPSIYLYPETPNTIVVRSEILEDVVIDADIFVENGGAFYLYFRYNTICSYLAAFPTTGRTDDYIQFNITDGISSHVIGETTRDAQITPGVWHRVRVAAIGSNFELYVDGEKIATATDSSYSEGFVGLSNSESDAYADNVRFTFDDRQSFENFLKTTENVAQSNGNEKKILLKQSGTNIPACLINYGIESGKGRSVWLSGADSMDYQRAILIKSLLVWVSGTNYEVVKTEIKEPVSVSMYKTLNNDMFEPVKIEVSLGYLY